MITKLFNDRYSRKCVHCARARVCSSLYASVRACMHVHVCLSVCLFVCMSVCLSICARVCMTCMCVRVCVCACLRVLRANSYAYIHTTMHSNN